MPSLKQLTCNIEKGTDNIPLTEYNTKYADGLVTSYVRVPSQSTTFSIHLTSSGYIAPGLAMFVFMDGVPQCNRNMRGLVIPDGTTAASETEIDFRVRQKEDKFDERRFIGRAWTFQGLNTTEADKIKGVDKDVLKSTGTIEVVVLRCHGDVRAIANDKRPVVRGANGDGVVDLGGQLDGHGVGDDPIPVSSPSMIGGFDGANDNPWPPSPSVPERYKHLDHRKKNHKTGGGGPLTGLDQAFQRQGISGYAPPNVDGAGGQYPIHPPAWPGYHQSPVPYQYPPPPWVYGPYYGQPPAGYGGPPATGQAAAGATEWKPMWAPQPDDEGSRAGGDAANDWDDDAKSNVKATSIVSAAKSDKGANDQNSGWDYGNDQQQDDGDKEWEKHTTGNDGNNQAADESCDTAKDDTGNNHDASNNDQPPSNEWNQDKSNDQPDNSGKNNDKQNAVSNGWHDSSNQQQNHANNNNASNDWDTPDPPKEKATKPSPSKKQKVRRPHRHSHHSHDGASDHSASKPARGASHIKPYWSKWAQPANLNADSTPGSASSPGNRDLYVVPAEPLRPVPKALAEKGDLTHQVRAGRGKLYYHSTGTPRYIDTMASPYAVFVFKYRSQEALERILPGVKIKKDALPLEARWKKMNEEERLAYLLKLQARVGSSDESSSGDEEGSGSDDSMITATTKSSRRTVVSVKSVKSAKSAKTVKSSQRTKKEKREKKRQDKKDKSNSNGGGNNWEDWHGGGGNKPAKENWSGGSGGNANKESGNTANEFGATNNEFDNTNNNDNAVTDWDNNSKNNDKSKKDDTNNNAGANTWDNGGGAAETW